jgi:hypothetical protein
MGAKKENLHVDIARTNTLTNQNQSSVPPILVSAQIRIVTPSEKELFTMFIAENKKLYDMVVSNRDEVIRLTASLEKARDLLYKHSPKKYISVKDMASLYDFSESQQKNLRNRINNSLPYHQNGQGGKIRYKISEIEEWMRQEKIL